MKDVIDTTFSVNEVLQTIVDDNDVDLLWFVFPRFITCSYFIQELLIIVLSYTWASPFFYQLYSWHTKMVVQ